MLSVWTGTQLFLGGVFGKRSVGLEFEPLYVDLL